MGGIISYVVHIISICLSSTGGVDIWSVVLIFIVLNWCPMQGEWLYIGFCSVAMLAMIICLISYAKSLIVLSLLWGVLICWEPVYIGSSHHVNPEIKTYTPRQCSSKQIILELASCSSHMPLLQFMSYWVHSLGLPLPSLASLLRYISIFLRIIFYNYHLLISRRCCTIQLHKVKQI